jgi:hypothetical protein
MMRDKEVVGVLLFVTVALLLLNLWVHAVA